MSVSDCSAPDLLLCLKAILETTELNMDDLEEGTRQKIELARAAIAKAENHSPVAS